MKKFSPMLVVERQIDSLYWIIAFIIVNMYEWGHARAHSEFNSSDLYASATNARIKCQTN